MIITFEYQIWVDLINQSHEKYMQYACVCIFTCIAAVCIDGYLPRLRLMLGG